MESMRAPEAWCLHAVEVSRGHYPYREFLPPYLRPYRAGTEHAARRGFGWLCYTGLPETDPRTVHTVLSGDHHPCHETPRHARRPGPRRALYSFPATGPS